VDECKPLPRSGLQDVQIVMEHAVGQGLTLVHFVADPKPILSLTHYTRPLRSSSSTAFVIDTQTPTSISHKKCLHSSTFRLNVSKICGIRWVHDVPPVYQTGGHGEVWPKRLMLS